MSKVGIGIITFNRLDFLQKAVAAAQKYTGKGYELVVADDGSTDGTQEWCKKKSIRVITGTNAGVCWNKNRALFALQELGCDPILLLEDDCVPIEYDYQWEWRIATALFGHVTFGHPKLLPWLISGSGSAIDPYVNNKASAQCSSASGMALTEVGFFDTRFKGYGVGHAEWTTRMKRAGYGFKLAHDKKGNLVKANLYIKGGLEANDGPTFRDKTTIALNEELFKKLKKESIYRHPWSNDEEREIFMREQKAAGLNGTRYKLLNENQDDKILGLNSRHLRPYGRAFQRAFNEPKSFLRTSGWLSSMALGIPAYEGEIVPWFNYAVVNLLKDRVRPNWSVFEFGAGYSTLWWASKVLKVHSVEHDSVWADLIGKIVKKSNVTITVHPADSCFAKVIDVAEGPFDVIVIDGHDRQTCLCLAINYLTPDGVIILDNSNRPEYRDVVADTLKLGFKELQIKSVAPMTYQQESTSFIYRENNCFGF